MTDFRGAKFAGKSSPGPLRWPVTVELPSGATERRTAINKKLIGGRLYVATSEQGEGVSIFESVESRPLRLQPVVDPPEAVVRVLSATVEDDEGGG